MKAKRTKKTPFLIRPFEPTKKVWVIEPLEEGNSKKQKSYKYETFPKFDYENFYQPRNVTNYNIDTSNSLKSLLNVFILLNLLE